MPRILFTLLFCVGLVVLGLSLATIRASESPSESAIEYIDAHRTAFYVQQDSVANREEGQPISADIHLEVIGASEILLDNNNNNDYTVRLYRSDNSQVLESPVTRRSMIIIDNFKQGYASLKFEFKLEPTNVSIALTEGEFIQGALLIRDKPSRRTLGFVLPKSRVTTTTGQVKSSQ